MFLLLSIFYKKTACHIAQLFTPILTEKRKCHTNVTKQETNNLSVFKRPGDYTV